VNVSMCVCECEYVRVVVLEFVCVCECQSVSVVMWYCECEYQCESLYGSVSKYLTA